MAPLRKHDNAHLVPTAVTCCMSDTCQVKGTKAGSLILASDFAAIGRLIIHRAPPAPPPKRTFAHTLTRPKPHFEREEFGYEG